MQILKIIPINNDKFTFNYTYVTSPPREGGLAVTALVLLVSCVQLDMAVSGTFVLEQTTTELTAERQLVGMGLNEKHFVNTMKEIPNHDHTH